MVQSILKSNFFSHLVLAFHGFCRIKLGKIYTCIDFEPFETNNLEIAAG